MTNEIQFYQTERVPSNLTRPKDTLYCDIIDQLKLLAELNEQLQEDKTNGNMVDGMKSVLSQTELKKELIRISSRYCD